MMIFKRSLKGSSELNLIKTGDKKMLFDTHAHYDDEQFDADRDELLSSMPQNNVRLIVNSCAAIEDIPTVTTIAEKYPFVYATAGVHPSDCGELTSSDLDIIEKAAANEKIRAIGEIGLDYYYDDVPKDVQKKWFEAQAQLAKALKMPVVIHDRDAHRDTLDILRAVDVRSTGGVFHCYSGSAEMAREVLDMGMYIAFGGVLTFKNAVRAVDAAKYVPLDRIVLETDSPYLAPVPNRGKRNSSLFIHFVAERLAEIKNISVDEVERVTFENGKKLFNIEEEF